MRHNPPAPANDPAAKALVSAFRPLAYSPQELVCPTTGLVVPFGEHAVDLFRELLNQSLEGNETAQRAIWEACRDDFSFWANAFAYTPHRTRIMADGRQVSVSGDMVRAGWRQWPVNDLLHKELQFCQGQGLSLAIPKSRDMRASLQMVLFFAWEFIFRPNSFGIILADRLDLIDGGDPEQLLPRIDSVLEKLPHWMMPRVRSKRVPPLRENLDNGAVISGTSKTSPGIGKRPDKMLFDEAARNSKFEEGWRGTADSTKFRVACSTLFGPEFFSRLVRSGVRVFKMPWWDHPLKGRGREIRINVNPLYPIPLDKPYVHSPWFHNEVWDDALDQPKRDVLGVAQDLMIDLEAGASGFFDSSMLLRLIQHSQKPENAPSLQGDFLRRMRPSPERDAALASKRHDLIQPISGVSRMFKWWGPLPNGRPRQDHTYFIFSDISSGQGASNSVAGVGCVETQSVAGMYADPNCEPGEWARRLVEMAYWVGGQGGGCKVCFERNFGGLIINEVWKSLRFVQGLNLDGSDEGPGWTSNTDAKLEAGLLLRESLHTGAIRVFDTEFFTEAGEWAYGSGGKIGPTKLFEDDVARSTHGDRVIAIMGLNMMLRRANRPAPAASGAVNTRESDAWKRFEEMRKMQMGGSQWRNVAN